MYIMIHDHQLKALIKYCGKTMNADS